MKNGFTRWQRTYSLLGVSEMSMAPWSSVTRPSDRTAHTMSDTFLPADFMPLAMAAVESVAKSHTIGLAVFGPDGGVAFTNPAVSILLDCEPPEVDDGSFTDLLPANIRHQISRTACGPDGDVVRESEADAKMKYVNSSGRIVLIRIRSWPVWHRGTFAATLVTFTDISDRLSDRTDAQLANNLVEVIMGSVADAVVMIDADQIVRSASESVETIFGWRPDELVGVHLKTVLAEPLSDIEREFAIRYGKSAERAPTIGMVATEVNHRFGGTVPVEAKVVDHAVGEQRGQILFVRDKSELSNLTRKVEVARNTDELTGLLTRGAFVKALGEILEESSEDIAVAKLDLVHFHNLNRLHGFAAANEFLRVVAAELRALSGGRPVARIGGDRFAVMVEHRSIGRFLQVLRSRLEARRRSRGISSSVRVAVGVARPVPDGGAEGLMKSAGVALREAKKRPRVGFVEFDEQMRLAEFEKADLLSNIHGALRSRQIVTWFQPVIDLATGDDIGYEALVRWVHPTRGVLAPDVFLRMLASEGLMPEMGVRVLTDSMSFASALDRAEMPGRVWVNLSPSQVREDGVVGFARASIEGGFDPSRLGFEITEHTALELDGEGMEKLVALREAGVSLAIDDFGTGYSSLSQLRTLPVDVVKLDRSFLSAIHTDPVQRGFVGACIDMSHALGCEVVAEGIEHEIDARVLADLGCDRAQGYHFGRPAPSVDILKRLR